MIFKRIFFEVISVASNSTSLLNRLKGTGVLSVEIVKSHGVVGIVMKAVGIKNDTRCDYPYAAYTEIFNKHISIEQGGDVYVRFNVRI